MPSSRARARVPSAPPTRGAPRGPACGSPCRAGRAARWPVFGLAGARAHVVAVHPRVGRRGTSAAMLRGASSMGPGSSAWTMNTASVPWSCTSAARTSSSRHVGELVDPRGHEEALEAQRAAAKDLPSPCGPRGCSRARRRPTAHVDVAPALGRAAFTATPARAGRRGDGVERHVDHRGDAPRGGRAGGALEALPLGAAGLVDVDVGVDHAGHQRERRRAPRRARRG
jgi:hypothetical protein